MIRQNTALKAFSLHSSSLYNFTSRLESVKSSSESNWLYWLSSCRVANPEYTDIVINYMRLIVCLVVVMAVDYRTIVQQKYNKHTDEMINSAREALERFDKDRDGQISMEEATTTFREHGVVSSEAAANFFGEVDLDRDGFVDLRELLLQEEIRYSVHNSDL